jgi:chemotaxis protein methyltransferase CheR
VRSLLQAIYERYGTDFRDYAYESISRRIASAMRAERLTDIADFERRLVSDTDAMERFLQSVTVHVTSMFRDPDFYLALRNRVVPLLKTHPFIRIWHAGCSTGEEVYSMAILLQEEGLYSRCRIYATDVSAHVVAGAKAGIFPLARADEYEANYREAGGRRSVSDYHTTRYDHLIFRASLKRNLVFSQHNLVSDGAFNEFQVILCRNVMIYFNSALSARVHELLYRSLAPSGFLGLGSRETIRFTPHEMCYESIEPIQHLYRKISQAAPATGSTS